MRCSIILLICLMACGKDKFLNHSFTDPSHVLTVSPMNSCCGHKYGSSKVSKKHYITAHPSRVGEDVWLQFRAPCDGQIFLAKDSDGSDCIRGQKVIINCRNNPSASVVFFHVTPTLPNRARVKSGQVFAHLTDECPLSDLAPLERVNRNQVDVAVPHRFGHRSVFHAMTNKAFETWAIYGLTSENVLLKGEACDFSTYTSLVTGLGCNEQSIELNAP
jgi:hypothetical protein